MDLVQLSDRTVLRNRKIVCIERSKEYISELCQRYNLQNEIEAIFDDNPRNLGTFSFLDRKIPVYDLKHLHSWDTSSAIVVITSDYYKEYFEKLTNLLEENETTNDIYFFANRETEYELSYRKKYAANPLENKIVFRSGPHAAGYVKGMDFADNARALFEYALSIGLNKKYELVWIVRYPEEFWKYADYENVIFLPFEGAVTEDTAIRDSYYRVLCLAKFFFFTDAYGFVRNSRQDQVRVQLWHGCGYKKRLSVLPCEKRYEYMTVSSPLYAKLHAKEFGLRKEQMLITGCAKTDWLFCPFWETLSLVGIPPARKYIFWLPTYRFSEKEKNKPVDGELNEETGLPMISHLQDLEDINQMLAEHGICLIIKPHPFQDRKALHVECFSNIMLLENEALVKNDLQINQILGAADALISDYSSTAVDYLILDRPMAFLLEDADRYSKSRGFIFEKIEEWLPGKHIFDLAGFLNFIEEIGRDQDTTKEKRGKLLGKMHSYTDAGSCRRILKALKIIKEE